MGRLWCQNDPIFHLNGRPAHVYITFGVEAKEALTSIEVKVAMPGNVTIPPGQQNRRIFGVPLKMSAISGAEQASVKVLIRSGDTEVPASVFVKLPAGPGLYGSGVTGETIEATGVVTR